MRVKIMPVRKGRRRSNVSLFPRIRRVFIENQILRRGNSIILMAINAEKKGHPDQDAPFVREKHFIYFMTKIVEVSLMCPKNASPLVENPILG